MDFTTPQEEARRIAEQKAAFEVNCIAEHQSEKGKDRYVCRCGWKSDWNKMGVLEPYRDFVLHIIDMGAEIVYPEPL